MAFKLKSGNSPKFKMVGSSPAKHDTGSQHVHAHGGSGSYDKKTGKQTGIGGDIDKDNLKPKITWDWKKALPAALEQLGKLGETGETEETEETKSGKTDGTGIFKAIGAALGGGLSIKSDKNISKYKSVEEYLNRLPKK
jgi:hypothetical protein